MPLIGYYPGKLASKKLELFEVYISGSSDPLPSTEANWLIRIIERTSE